MSQGATVLLVEDNVDHAELIGSALEDAGYTVCVAHNGATAEDVLARTHVDIALVDYSLGGETGFDLLERVHARRPELPVVLLTGHDSEELAVGAVQRGAADFIVKSLHSGFMRVLPLYVSKNLERSRLTVALGAAEAEQVRQATYRRLVFDSLDAVVFSVDEHFIVKDVNLAMRVLLQRLGGAELEPVGKSADQVFGPAALRSCLQALRTALVLGEEQLLQRSLDLSVGEGQPRLELFVEATPLASADRGEGVVFVITDVSERNRSQRALESLNSELGAANEALERQSAQRVALVDGVSRELRSPTQAIGGFAKMLGSGALGELPERALSAIQTVERSAQRLERLADNLDYLAGRGAQEPVQGQAQCLAELVDVAQRGGLSQRRSRRIRLRRNIPDPAPRILGQRDRLVELLSTLLEDVETECANNSTLFCRVERAEGWVRLWLECEAEPRLKQTPDSGPLVLELQVARETAGRSGGSVTRLSGSEGGRRGWLLELPGLD